MTRTFPTTVAANGPAPETAFALYPGDVMHARLKPVGHRFRYRVFSLLADLDRLGDAKRLAPWFAVNRFAPLSLHEADHGAGDGSPLRPHVDRLLTEAGLPRPDRVLMLCYPRVLGYVFDPLTVYFAYQDDTLTALLYEVRNTFGERHTYVVPVEAGDASAAGISQSAQKAFYVSPFMPMEETYRFRILPPGEAVRIRILESDADGPTFAATFAGRHVPASRGALARCFFAIPLMSFKVIAGIHFEALRLWLKRVPLVSRASAPKRASPVSIVATRSSASTEDERSWHSA
ncbi:DUF1365 domain-containing protein [Amorphus sp. 3PC139-8]|uniref:DUF1365 domain-containing protein n=1 Tax=Amorphus sp. 3PC139-8 TaxID=2735676 RepID=UPI00345D3269